MNELSADPLAGDHLARDLFARYLGLLSVPPRPAGPDVLAEIIEAHLTCVPYVLKPQDAWN